MINPFKLFTRSGRQSIASEAWDAVITPENITATVSEQVTKAIADSKLPLDRAVAITECADRATDVVREILKAAEDKVITYTEAETIITKTFEIFGADLAGTLAALKGKVIESIP